MCGVIGNETRGKRQGSDFAVARAALIRQFMAPHRLSASTEIVDRLEKHGSWHGVEPETIPFMERTLRSARHRSPADAERFASADEVTAFLEPRLSSLATHSSSRSSKRRRSHFSVIDKESESFCLRLLR